MNQQPNKKGGKPRTRKAARNQSAALRRVTAPKPESDDDGLRRFLGVDPAVDETMRRAGL